LNPRIVIDTNVLVSGIFFETGNEAKVLDAVINNKLTLVTSLEILQEIRGTLAAEKFGLTPTEAFSIFQLILSISEILLTPPAATKKCRDPDDQKFLDCAAGGNAEFLVTGDKDLIELKTLGRTRIVPARHIVKMLPQDPFFQLKPVRFREKVGKRFDSLHPGFNYREADHEASRYLFRDSKAKKIQKKK
jgi:uncharacterized protein